MTRGPRWERRRRSALALRVLVLAAPLVAAVIAVQLVASSAPVPRGSAALLWWAGLLVVASAAAWAADRAARRLQPLAVLLDLSLPFPGPAPSRWSVASRVATARARQEHVSTARRWRRLGPAVETPEQAVHRVLPLVLAVSADDRTAPGHVDRVVATTDLLSSELGLPGQERDALRWSALVSQLGLLTTRSSGYAADSARLTGGLLPWLGSCAEAVARAGDRYDAGTPLGARVLAVATAFASLTQRDERGRLPDRDAVHLALRARAGTTLDPALVTLLTAAPAAALAYAFGPWARTAAGLLGAVRPAGVSVPVTAAAVGLTLTAVGLGTAAGPTLDVRDRLARNGSLLDSQAGDAMGGFVGPRPEHVLTLGSGTAEPLAGGTSGLLLPPGDAPGASGASGASPPPTASPAASAIAGSAPASPSASAPGAVTTSAAAPETTASDTDSPATRPTDPPPASGPGPAAAPAGSTPPPRSPEPTGPDDEKEPEPEPAEAEAEAEEQPEPERESESPKPQRSKRPKGQGQGEPTPTAAPTP